LTDEPLDDLPYVEHLYRYLMDVGYSRVKEHKQIEEPPLQEARARRSTPPAARPELGTWRHAHLKDLKRRYPDKALE
jgi:hypothetical protein